MAYKNKEEKKEYYKKYYQKNKEYLKEYSKKYNQEHKEYRKEYIKNWKENKPEYQKQWRKNNPGYMKEYGIQWRKENFKKIEAYGRKYYQEHKQEHKDEMNKYSRQWRKNNPEKVKETRRKYYTKKYKLNYKFRLSVKMCSSIKKTLKGNKAGRHWENLVGYTLNDLIKRLKKTIPKGYNWNDYLEGKLHIDHIIPISVFNFDCSENPDFKNCWALSNLQLLPAKENLIKGNKITRPFQPALKIKEVKNG